MKSRFTKHLLTPAAIAFGQGNLYTRKARLADFPTRTTKVVLSGGSLLELVLKESVISNWRVSHYEFCTSEEYDKLKSSNDYYFLTLASDEGIAFLILTKGGKSDESDNLKKPFEVIRVPVASIGEPSGRELVFMGAFIDIIQTFAEDAMGSDKIAYGGLDSYNSDRLSGKQIYVDTEKVDSLYLASPDKVLLGLVITPTEITFGTFCYKMLISADTHELLYYKKVKYRGPKDSEFTDGELKMFKRRNGIVRR